MCVCVFVSPAAQVQRVVQLAFAEVYDLSERFAFRVSNPQRNTTFFASSENGKKEWMRTIHRSIQSSLEQRREVISGQWRFCGGYCGVAFGPFV